ncbi:hypothetical protein [Pseudoxanthomonas yeongjuensis]|uniref:hypothetical protein n=1 Tax=Pseudoxanthomonas yeongjuensis TaxID=377616 RepID=UPI001479C047|nr:hypothetical protein [Pseudoxanthomonas yeongjuensis]
MFARYVLALTLSVASLAVLAEQPYVDLEQRLSAEQLHATGLDSLSAEQLKLLNSLLRDDVARAVEAGKAETRENNGPGRGAASLIGFNDEPIRSRLNGPVNGWEPGTEFMLENGQTWKVLKGSMKLRKPFESPEIMVIPGIAGRWFLQVDEDLPKARVYRID